jgi:hypothetical protein
MLSMTGSVTFRRPSSRKKKRIRLPFLGHEADPDVRPDGVLRRLDADFRSIDRDRPGLLSQCRRRAKGTDPVAPCPAGRPPRYDFSWANSEMTHPLPGPQKGLFTSRYRRLRHVDRRDFREHLFDRPADDELDNLIVRHLARARKLPTVFPFLRTVSSSQNIRTSGMRWVMKDDRRALGLFFGDDVCKPRHVIPRQRRRRLVEQQYLRVS